MSALRLEGVFTPSAQVLCIACHGPTFYKTLPLDEFAARVKPRACESDEASARCDKCRTPIWARRDVATLQALGLEIGEWSGDADLWGASHLEQTGGMCVALAVRLDGEEAGKLAIVTDDESTDGPSYNVGFFTYKAWHEGADDDDASDWNGENCVTYKSAREVRSAIQDRVAKMQLAAMCAHPIGTRVRLAHAVDRFPHFIAPKGAEGVISSIDKHSVCVKLDLPLAGCEEWDNEVVWTEDDLTSLTSAIEVVS